MFLSCLFVQSFSTMETHEEYTHKGARRKENALSMPISRGKKNEVYLQRKKKKSFLLDHTVKNSYWFQWNHPGVTSGGGLGWWLGSRGWLGVSAAWFPAAPCSALEGDCRKTPCTGSVSWNRSLIQSKSLLSSSYDKICRALTSLEEFSALEIWGIIRCNAKLCSVKGDKKWHFKEGDLCLTPGGRRAAVKHKVGNSWNPQPDQHCCDNSKLISVLHITSWIKRSPPIPNL